MLENLRRIIRYFESIGDDVAAEAFRAQLAMWEAE